MRLKLRSTTWGFLALALLLVAFFSAGNWYYFKHQQAAVRRGVQETLTAIADLKVSQIEDWMRERRHNAESSFENDTARMFLADPNNATLREGLLQWMGTFQQDYSFSSIMLLDAQGAVRLSVPAGAVRPDGICTEQLSLALRARGVVFVDLHSDPLHMSFLIPIGIKPQADQPADGVLMMAIDPQQFLFPLIRSWPTPSPSAETLVVRREGNDVVFLNQLRHRANTPLALRLPMEQPILPAALAIQGQEGMAEGKDYRGVPVLTALRKVPGTPWFLVAKVDQEELYAPLHQQARAIGIIAGLLMLAVLLGVALLWRQKDLVLSRRELAERKVIEAQLRTSEERWKFALEGAGDGVWELEIPTLEMQFSKRWHEIGFAGSETANQYERWKDLIHLDERPGALADLQAVVDGHTLTYLHEFRMRYKDGSYRWILSRGMVVSHDAVGQPLYMVGTHTDITEHKKAKEILRLSEEKRRRLFETMSEGVFYQQADGLLTGVNPAALRMFGLTRDEFLNRTSMHSKWDVIQEDGSPLPGDQHPSMQVLSTGKPVHDLVVGILNPRTKAYTWVTASGIPEFREGETTPYQAFVTLHDMTKRKRAEEAEREAQERLALAVDGAELGTWEWNVATGAIELNEHWATMLGYELDEIELHIDSAYALTDPDDLPRLHKLMGVYLAGESPYYEAVYRMRHKSGEWIWVHDRARVTKRSDDGTPLRVCGTHTDISRQMRMEDDLRLSEEKLRLTVVTAPIGICTVDPQGNFVMSNPAYEQMLGYSKEELRGLSFFDVTHPEDRPENKELFQSMFALESTSFSIEKRYIRKDGKTIDVAVSATGIMNAAGQVRFGTAFAQDITERKKADANLRESQQLLEGIINSIPVRVFWKDTDLVYLGCNDAFAHDAGCSDSTEIVGKTDCQMPWKDQAKLYNAEDRRVIDGETILDREEPQTTPEGEALVHVTSKVPLRNAQGEISGILGAYVDITEQRKTEAQLQQAQKMESVGQLAGGVAHDFNNQLQVILGYTEMALGQTSASEQLHENLTVIETAALHSADLTRQLLAFARKQTIAPVILDLNGAVEEMLKMLRRLIGEDIDLAWLPGAGLWAVKMDPAQIDQILANLCVNARDAFGATEGNGKVTIETRNITLDQAACTLHPDSSPGDYVQLSFSDNGCGMEQSVLDHIFEPFFTTKKLGEGTGLGLATLYGIIKQNNGLTTVYSSPKHGTTFKLYLPRCRDEEVNAEKVTEKKPPEPGQETILLAEDDPALLKLAVRMLEGLGYSVLAATLPAEILRLAKEHPGDIDLLLTDVIMPEMNGQDLFVQLEKPHPNLKCLFMSGYTADVIARNNVLAEGVNFIQKPFSTRELATKLRIVLDK